jgi:hypothetical protein
VENAWSLFYPVITFWLGLIAGILLWAWRDTKFPFRGNPWCWFRNHIWVERKPHRIYQLNKFDCERCGKISIQGYDHHEEFWEDKDDSVISSSS